jgi:hypothetical protein
VAVTPAVTRERRPWAAQPSTLEWTVHLNTWTATSRVVRWVIEVWAHEVIARCELRLPGNRRWADLGSFRDVPLAMAACQRDADRRHREVEREATLESEEPVSIDVRIAPDKRRG